MFDGNFILISFQELWAIQFYQILYGNYWEFEMSDWEITNISRMVNGKNMNFAKTLQIEKFSKFGVCSIYRFYAIINFRAKGKRNQIPFPLPSGLIGSRGPILQITCKRLVKNLTWIWNFAKLKGKHPCQSLKCMLDTWIPAQLFLATYQEGFRCSCYRSTGRGYQIFIQS